MKHENNYSWSKLLTVVTLGIFILCVLSCLILHNNQFGEGVIVTASGSVALTCIVWYLKKAQAENIAKIQIEYYKNTMDIRVKYNERMLKLKQKYNEEISEEESIFDELSDEVFDEGKSVLQDFSTDAKSKLERSEVN